MGLVFAGVFGSSVKAADISYLPKPDHVVIVVEENHSFSQIVGNVREADFINDLAGEGALLTQYHGIGHPSQPNYLVLFSGSTQGVHGDQVPAPRSPFTTPNLAEALQDKGLTFAAYAEDLPSAGFTGNQSGSYVRRHAPWANWIDAAKLALPFSDFPSDYSKLPTVSFVIPGVKEDMHDGSIYDGDRWLKQNLSGYAEWAKTHNSLLIVTYDEDNWWHGNQVPAIFIGSMVKPGKYSQRLNHYNLFETLVSMYGLDIADPKNAPIADIWLTQVSSR